MSYFLTYENIVSKLSEFVERCDIMPRGSNARHKLQAMTSLMMQASTCRASVGGFADATRESGGESMPSGEWVRKAFVRAEPGMVRNAIEDVISTQVAKLQKYGIMNGAITIAIDKHLIPRYDKRPGPELLRSKSKKGTWKFEAYITAQCVDAGSRLTLAVLPIGMGDSTAEFVRKITQICRRQNIKIRCFLMDREFFSAYVLNNMNSDNQRYVVPCKNTYNVVDALNEFDRRIRDGTSNVTLEGKDVSVKYVMVIEKRTSRKDKSPDAEAKERYIGFAANSNETDVAAYLKRWGIETGYRMIENLRLKTRSTRPAARLFCFVASVILFNQWVILNAQSGFGRDSRWQGITFTTLMFKVVMQDWKLSNGTRLAEPPPDGTVTSHVRPSVG